MIDRAHGRTATEAALEEIEEPLALAAAGRYEAVELEVRVVLDGRLGLFAPFRGSYLWYCGVGGCV